MKKALSKALLVLVLTLTVFIGWNHRQIQVVRAVEVQPGVVFLPETSGPIETLQKNRPVAVDPVQQAAPSQTGRQSSGAPQIEQGSRSAANNLPSLETFISQVRDEQPDDVRGLYIPGLIALRIVQQPDGQFDFISYEEDTATQFQSSSLFGVIGLLAHNFLSGRSFLEILPGQFVTIVYGDGQTEDFQVAEIHDYQRLTELDLHSDFQDLNTNQTLTANQVFQQYYQGQRHLTLQTCLEKEGNWNWGIRMVTAYPVSTSP